MFSGARSISSRIRLGFAVLLGAILTLSMPLSASAAAFTGGNISSNVPAASTRAINIVSRIIMAPRTPNVIAVDQLVTLSFYYNTTWSPGVIVRAVPFTGTAKTASSTVCQTAVLPAGHGTGSCTISVGAGPVVVDSIKVSMWDPTLKTLLFVGTLPTNFQVKSDTNLISTLVLTPASPSVQLLGKGISVKFNYNTDQAGGVKIFAIPYTGTSPTPNATTCASPIYAVGSGTGSCRFAILSAAANVSGVQMEMWNAAQTKLIAKFFISAAYRFRNQATLVTYTALSPITPNIIRISSSAVLHFHYQTDQSAGIVVEAIPYSGTTPTANVTVVKSAVLPVGTGIGSCSFVVNAGPVNATSVRVNVWDAAHTKLLFMVYLPVQYQFR